MTRYNAAEQDASPQTIECFPASCLFRGWLSTACIRVQQSRNEIYENVIYDGRIHLDARNSAILTPPRALSLFRILYSDVFNTEIPNRDTYEYDNE